MQTILWMYSVSEGAWFLDHARLQMMTQSRTGGLFPVCRKSREAEKSAKRASILQLTRLTDFVGAVTHCRAVNPRLSKFKESDSLMEADVLMVYSGPKPGAGSVRTSV